MVIPRASRAALRGAVAGDSPRRAARVGTEKRERGVACGSEVDSLQMSESQRHASGSVTRWLVGGIPLVVALGLGVLFAIPAECPTCYGGKPIWIGLAGIPPLAPNPCPSCLQQRHVSLAKAWYLRAMGTNEISRSPSLSTLIVMAIACIAVMSWVSFVPIARRSEERRVGKE